MQNGRRRSGNCWRVVLAVLAGISGFTSNTHAQTSYQVLAAFGQPYSSGAAPYAGLIQGTDGGFYGTTSEGGAANRGTIFKVDAGTLTILHSFASNEGTFPQARLLQASDGRFYGTTVGGGGGDRGTIFRVDAAGTLTTLHSFNYSDGDHPSVGLIEGGDGSFYGTTLYGGSTGQGTVFKIDAAGTLTTLHSFNFYLDGGQPAGGVIQGSDGNFYGVASTGGAMGCGTVFRIDAAGTLTTLHSFDCGAGGSSPYDGIIQGTDGSFYGTTWWGGAMGLGTVFKVDRAGTLTTLYSFNSTDGANPYGALIQGSDGSFYGTTSTATTGPGTIFKIAATGTLTTLFRFNSANGAYPYGGVIQGRDGSFYGTTSTGGANGSGVVFRLTVPMPTSTALTVSPSPSMSSQSITLTAIVSTPGLTPTGSVTFFDGSISLGSGTLSVGTATLRTSTLSSGSHALRAEYAGAGAFAPSASAVVAHIVVLPATFIYPANNATNVDPTQPFTWTSVPGVQAYYLYVGTSVGAKDLVSTGEIQQTSYRVPLTLATGATVYARLWTKVGGAWRYVDAAFTAPPIARFIYPDLATTTVDPALPLAWTAVPAAQAYYLYIGSTPGAKDLVNTGEIQQTSYLLRSTVPVNQTLYARLWTKAGGVWRFTDRTFSVMSPVAYFTYPAPGATTIEWGKPLTWTSIQTAEAFIVNVGSTLGAKDLVNTGEIQRTYSFLPDTLPANQTLYARLWTKVAGAWRFTDRTFSVLPAIARFIYPASFPPTADPTQPITWTAVPNAQAYYLYVGSSLGARDLVNSGEIQQTSYLIRNTRPVDQMLYARLWTKIDGAWRYGDISFTATFATPLRFTYPTAGVTLADLSQPFQWTPVANAQAYALSVGTALGQHDLVSTGDIQATSYLAANLPLNRPLYARLWVKVADAWSYIDRVIISISPDATVIGFGGLTVNGASFTSYTESGFTVSALSGPWVGVTNYGQTSGQPIGFIDFSGPGGATVTGEVHVSAGGAVFTFNSVNLYSSTTPIPYTITGLRNSSTVFTISGTLPNTFGEFRTVANPSAAAVIDTLSIVLTNAAFPCCGNPMGLDTIVLTR
jgi:uncharacterized repeat protein (TIGR03803 family)